MVAKQQTYENLRYLALTFPLGLFYFVLLATGVSLGVSMLAAVVGLPILIGLLVLSDRLLVVERWLARRLLGHAVPLDRDSDVSDWRDYVRKPMTDLVTWIGVVYLAAKFLIGLVTFVVLGLLSLHLCNLLAQVQGRITTRAIRLRPVEYSID